MTLYEIDQAILDLVDAETGEILDWDAFEQLKMDREAKIENTALWYKNLVAEATAIRAEEVALAERRKSVEGKANRLKAYLAQALNGQKFQTARCAISWRRTTSVDLVDETAVIAWAQEMNRDDILKYAAPDVNKSELAKVLKSNVQVPGAVLAEGLSMGVK